jgi:hypothetical protein
VAAARKASRYFRSVICLRSTRPRSQIATIYTMQSLSTRPPRSVASLARAGSRRPPQQYPPCVFRSPTLFSACSQHTGSPYFVWCVCRPLALFSAIAHSISSIIGPLSVFTCFPCAHSTRECPVRFGSTHWVWRFRLRLPTPGLVGSPHVHSSCLAPVSFAGMSTHLRLQPPPGLSPRFLPTAGLYKAVSA